MTRGYGRVTQGTSLAVGDVVARDIELPGVVRSVRAARSFVEDAIGDCPEGVRNIAVLLVSELATNAVLHAQSGFDVRVRVGDDRLRIEVHDGSPTPPVVKDYGVDAVTGRGVRLVQLLSSRWDVDTGPDGKTVWFELSLAGVRDDEKAWSSA
jgi:hypothetical protein